MLSKQSISLYIVFAISIALAGCNLPIPDLPLSAQIGETVTVAIEDPIDLEYLQAGKWVDVKTFISHPTGVGTVKLLVNGELYRQDHLSIDMQHGDLYLPWLPVGPGTYTLQVRVQSDDGGIDSNIISVTVGEEIQEAIEIPPLDESGDPTATNTVITPETPTFTPFPTITTTSTLSAPMATAGQSANCRYGPGPVYGVISSLLEGQSSLIIGRNQDSSWWLIEQIDGTGSCWIWAELVSVRGDVSQVSFVVSPPTPTHTPTETPPPTSTFTPSPSITATPTADPCAVSPSSCFTPSP